MCVCVGRGRAWSGRVEMCVCVCVGRGKGMEELRCEHVCVCGKGEGMEWES